MSFGYSCDARQVAERQGCHDRVGLRGQAERFHSVVLGASTYLGSANAACCGRMMSE